MEMLIPITFFYYFILFNFIFFDECYMSLEEIKDFNGLIDNKPFFDQPVKNKQEM